MKKTIAITTGGTGGHYFPAKALCDAFLKDNYKVLIFLDKRAYKYKHIWDKRTNIYKISSLGLKKRSIWCIIKMLLIISIGFWQSFFHFLKNRPNVLISFGGYSSIPTVFTAIILRIPIIMHEQNAILGKAHRLFLRFAKLIATNFQDTKNIPSYASVKHVGLPVRKEFIFFRNKQKEENQDILTICILGGSLGAKIFSDSIPIVFSKLSSEEQKKIVVYHQCREELLELTNKKWEKTQVKYVIKPFFNNISKILWEANLVIARSGSSSIAEINTVGRYAFYIPYALAAENHQELNAINAKLYSGADYVLEKEFNVDVLLNVIKKALSNSAFLRERELIAKNSSDINSTVLLKKIIEDIIR